MTVFWTSSSFNYYLITFFLKYIPGNIYLNTSLACIAELVAYAISGAIMKVFGTKLSFMIAFILAGRGGILLNLFFNSSGGVIATFVLFTKFGVSFAFNISYLATPQMFPTALCATAFGVCNLFARFSTVLSPLVSELPYPLPMLVLSIMCFASAVLALFLRTKKEEPKQAESESTDS